jgi:hypothetical protein
MRLKTVLMGSVSALATGAVATVPAQAQDQGYVFSVQGGALFGAADPYAQSATDKTGDKTGFGTGIVNSDVPENFGYTGAVTVGKRINSEWDVMFGASVNRLIDAPFSSFGSGSGSSSFVSGDNTTTSSAYYELESNGVTSFGFETMDFEVGYTPVLTPDFSVRLFAGVHGLHFERSADVGFDYYISGFSETVNNDTNDGAGYTIDADYNVNGTTRSEFFGAGPRAGISTAHRFGGSNFGLSGTLAGSAVFGRQTDTFTDGGSITGSGSSYTIEDGVDVPGTSSALNDGGMSGSSYSYDKTIFGLEASAGVDYYLDQSSTLTFGYQAKGLYNVGFGDGEGSDSEETSRLTHGPFMKFTSSF